MTPFLFASVAIVLTAVEICLVAGYQRDESVDAPLKEVRSSDAIVSSEQGPLKFPSRIQREDSKTIFVWLCTAKRGSTLEERKVLDFEAWKDRFSSAAQSGESSGHGVWSDVDSGYPYSSDAGSDANGVYASDVPLAKDDKKDALTTI